MKLSLQRTRDGVRGEAERLRAILADMPLTARSRYALAEIVLIRAAAVLETAIADFAYKIACGAAFENGDRDTVHAVCRSLIHARTLMLSENGQRQNPKQYLKWTKASYISESSSCLIDVNGHFLNQVRRFGKEIREIFEVRHYVAHRNASSRERYKKWIRAQYGQDRNIQVGYFLLTQNLNPVSNLERYLTYLVVISDEIAAGR